MAGIPGRVDEVRREAEELARAKVKAKIAWSGLVGNPIWPAGRPLLEHRSPEAQGLINDASDTLNSDQAHVP